MEKLGLGTFVKKQILESVDKLEQKKVKQEELTVEKQIQNFKQDEAAWWKLAQISD